jgi:hypothetical protein
MFKHGKHLYHAARIHSALIVVRYVNVCWQSDSDGNSFLGNDTSSRDFALAAAVSNLNDFIKKIGVSNLISSYLSKSID